MSDAFTNIPESLKIALKAKRVVPFIGAGISRAIEKKDKDALKPFNPLFPSWKEFLVWKWFEEINRSYRSNKKCH